MSELIIPKAGESSAALLEKRVTALKVVDSILKMPRPQRWIAARNVWVALHPVNALAHREACEEVGQAKMNSLDKEYGRSASALGKNKGMKSNNATSNRLVAIFPSPLGGSSLMDFLKRVDPEFLAMPNGKEYRLNWRQVYKAFPEYTVPTKVDGYYEGREAKSL